MRSSNDDGAGTGDGGLRRELGLLDSVVLCVGGMVGAAIFVFPGSTGRLVGPAAVLAWLLAGVLMLAIALCYTELALAFPRAGGPAVYPYETFGPNPTVRRFFGYLEGVSYAVGWTFAVTVSALAVADYLAVLVPGAAGHTVPVALLAVALCLLVNLVGVDVTSRANLALSAFVLAVLVAFAGVGLATLQPRHFDPVVRGSSTGFLAATSIALTAYGAWTAIPAAVEEIRAPERSVPRAIVVSLVVTTVLFTLVVAAIHGVVPATAFVEGGSAVTAPLGTAAERLGVGWLGGLLPLAAIVAIFTTMLVGTLSAGRVLLALGRQGALPGAFAAVDSRFGVPWVGLTAVSAVAAGLALFPDYFYRLLVIATLVGTGLPYAINVGSFVGLRYYRTDVEPPFRAPGGLWLAAVALLALVVAMVGLGSTEVVWSLGALGVICGYYVVRHFSPWSSTATDAAG